MKRGLFITLEGGDGAGKSTQTRLLSEHLARRGREVVVTREVGGAVGAEAIRTLWLSKEQGFWDPMTEALLITAARREHLVRTIWPALERGAWVVCDRFVDSTRVYQGLGLGLGLEAMDALYQTIAGSFWPDMTFVLDLPVKEGLQRMQSRGAQLDRYESQNDAFHETLRRGFLTLAKTDPRLIVVDAAADPQAVAASIAARIDERLLEHP